MGHFYEEFTRQAMFEAAGISDVVVKEAANGKEHSPYAVLPPFYSGVRCEREHTPHRLYR